MTEFVIRIVSDVLGHVAIEVFKRRDIGRISSLNPTEFVVLLPQVTLDKFDCRQELEDRNVAFCESGVASFRVSRQRHGRQCGASDTQALQEGSPPDDAIPPGVNIFSFCPK